MTTDRELLEMALEALTENVVWFSTDTMIGRSLKEKTDKAITSLRQAIEQAEKQEPVAWMVYTLDGKSVCVTDNPADFTESHRALPLYTIPQPQQVKQEPKPICWEGEDKCPNRQACCDAEECLYTTPQPQRELNCVCGAVWEGDEMVCVPHKREWVGLTEEQRSEAIDSVPANNIGGEYYYEEVEQVAKIIEAQLKEQNT
jgi:hypothetical protein